MAALGQPSRACGTPTAPRRSAIFSRLFLSGCMHHPRLLPTPSPKELIFTPPSAIGNRKPAIPSSRRDFRETQRKERLARDAEVFRVMAIDDGKYFSFATARARGGRTRGLGVGRHRKGFMQFTHLGGFEFEGRIAVVADVVETARGLAGVKDILGPTLGACNGNRGKPHRQSEWRSTTGGVKSARLQPSR